MDRPSKKDIKASIDKLKAHGEGKNDVPASPMPALTEKKGNQRIRKKGV